MPGQPSNVAPSVDAALKVALKRREGLGPVTSCLVIAALAETEPHAEWHRLWLQIGEMTWDRASWIPDADTAAGGEVVTGPSRLGPAVVVALERANRLAHRYGQPLTAGFLVLAFADDPSTGFARECAARGVAHTQVVELVEEILVGSRLGSRDPFPAAGTSSSPVDHPVDGPTWTGAADDVGLLRLLTREPSVAAVLEPFGLTHDAVAPLVDKVRRLGTRPAGDVLAKSGGDARRTLAEIAATPSTGLRRLLVVLQCEPAALLLATRNGSARGDLSRTAAGAWAQRFWRLRQVATLVAVAVVVWQSWTERQPLGLVLSLVPIVLVFPRVSGWAVFAGIFAMAELTPDWTPRSQMVVVVLNGISAWFARHHLARRTGLELTPRQARRTMRALDRARRDTEPMRTGLGRAWQAARLERDLEHYRPAPALPRSAVPAGAHPGTRVAPSPAAPSTRSAHTLSGPAAPTPAPEPAAPPPVNDSPPPTVAAADPSAAKHVLTRLRWRTRLLRGTSVAALVLTYMALATSSAGTSAPLLPLPPYTPNAAAEHLVGTDDITAALGRPAVLTATGLVPEKLHSSNGLLAREFVAATEDASWYREWLSTDQTTTVSAVAIDYRRRSFAPRLTWFCGTGTAMAAPGAAEAITTQTATRLTAGCARVLVGRSVVYVGVTVEGVDSASKMESALRGLVQRQVPRLVDRPDEAVPPKAFASVGPTLDRLFRLVLLGVALALGLPVALDRATRRRLLSRLRRRPHRTFPVVDLEPVAARDLAWAQASTLLRFAGYAWALRLSQHLHVAAGAGTMLPALTRTVGVLALTFTVFTGIEWAVRRRSPRHAHSPRLPRRAVTGPALALVVTAGVLGVAGFGVLSGVSVVTAGTNPGGPDFLATRLGILLVVGSVLLGAGALLPFTLARRFVMRGLRDQATSDERPVALLLRSFNDDRLRLRSRRLDRASPVERLCLRRRERFEEIVVAALGQRGAVEAIGEPKQYLPPALGAVRRQYSEEHWQGAVQAYLPATRLVCVTLGRTSPLMWEISQIRQLGALHKTVFLLPPVRHAEALLRLRALSAVLEVPWAALAPPVGSTVLGVVCPAWNRYRPVLLTARAPDDVSYDCAVEAATVLLDPSAQPSPEVRAVIGASLAGRMPAVAPVMEPPLKVWDWYMGPKHRNWYANPWLPWALTLVLPLLATFAFGQDLRKLETVTLADGVTATAVAQDSSSSSLYAVLNSRYVVSLDLASRGVKRVAERDDQLSELVVASGVVYVDSVSSGRVEALTVQGVSRWTSRIGGSVRGLTVTPSGVYGVDPAEQTVVRLDVATGRVLARRRLDGVPWDLAATPSGLDVVLEDSGSVLSLDPSTLAVTSTRGRVPHAQKLLVVGEEEWAYAPTDNRVSRVDEGGRAPAGPVIDSFLVQNTVADVQSNGHWMAILGFERVTRIGPGSDVRRMPLVESSNTVLCVERDGSVVVVGGRQIARLS